ncbi:MAG: cobalamin B12-binding domain-containing protein [Gammaproteobacteria bacterium]
MNEPKLTAAELLETSASGYAAAAASRLLGDNESLRNRYGSGAVGTWRAHFSQRLLELAAAVRMEEPELFAGRVVWQQKAFAVRGSDTEDLTLGLLALKTTLAEELPEGMREIVDAHLQAGVDALGVEHEPDPSRLDPKNAHGALALQYLVACLEGNVKDAIQLILDAAGDGLSIETLYLHVLFPAQQEIGRMWHGGEASVAEERVVTETTRRAMAALSHEQSSASDIGKTVLAASVARDAHDIGIRAVADFFQVAGWRAISLGSDVPPQEIANAARIFDVDLVVLATTLSTQLKQLQASIESIRSVCGDSVKVLVGGHAFIDTPELWKSTGADAFAADAGDAVARGAELLGLPKPD